MENFKIESRYLKLCYEFRAVIGCMKAAFYRPDYQKFVMYPLIKRFTEHLFRKTRSSLSNTQLSCSFPYFLAKRSCGTLDAYLGPYQTSPASLIEIFCEIFNGSKLFTIFAKMFHHGVLKGSGFKSVPLCSLLWCCKRVLGVFLDFRPVNDKKNRTQMLCWKFSEKCKYLFDFLNF